MTAGTVVAGGRLVIRATRTGADTMAASSAFVVASSVRLRRLGAARPPVRAWLVTRSRRPDATGGQADDEEEPMSCPG